MGISCHLESVPSDCCGRRGSRSGGCRAQGGCCLAGRALCPLRPHRSLAHFPCWSLCRWSGGLAHAAQSLQQEKAGGFTSRRAPQGSGGGALAECAAGPRDAVPTPLQGGTNPAAASARQLLRLPCSHPGSALACECDSWGAGVCIRTPCRWDWCRQCRGSGAGGGAGTHRGAADIAIQAVWAQDAGRNPHAVCLLLYLALAEDFSSGRAA